MNLAYLFTIHSFFSYLRVIVCLSRQELLKMIKCTQGMQPMHQVSPQTGHDVPGRFHGSIANASGFGSPNSFTFPVNGRYFFYLNTSFETTGEKHNPETKANRI